MLRARAARRVGEEGGGRQEGAVKEGVVLAVLPKPIAVAETPPTASAPCIAPPVPAALRLPFPLFPPTPLSLRRGRTHAPHAIGPQFEGSITNLHDFPQLSAPLLCPPLPPRLPRPTVLWGAAPKAQVGVVHEWPPQGGVPSPHRSKLAAVVCRDSCSFRRARLGAGCHELHRKAGRCGVGMSCMCCCCCCCCCISDGSATGHSMIRCRQGELQAVGPLRRHL